MKKCILIALVLAAVIFTAGCIDETTSEQNNSAPQISEGNSDEKILIAYFSRTGNTKVIADDIQKITGGDIFEIKTVQTYPTDYSACTELAQKEQRENARPELLVHVENISDYDVIFVGYPIWWGTMPMALFTFLEEYDLSSKKIVPFCTSGGSGFGRSLSDISALCPNSEILEGFTVLGSNTETAEKSVEEWITKIGL